MLRFCLLDEVSATGFYLFSLILLYFFKGVIYVLLKVLHHLMRSDFRSISCFSGVMVYPGLAMVGKFVSDEAKSPWFLLLLFLHLPPTL